MSSPSFSDQIPFEKAGRHLCWDTHLSFNGTSLVRDWCYVQAKGSLYSLTARDFVLLLLGYIPTKTYSFTEDCVISYDSSHRTPMVKH